MTWHGIPRKEIPWYPTIDQSLCNRCLSCLQFCKYGCYGVDDINQMPTVVEPYNCKVGCSLCIRICPVEAISFPDMKDLQQFVAEYRRQHPLRSTADVFTATTQRSKTSQAELGNRKEYL